jgi:hypothetical protein
MLYAGNGRRRIDEHGNEPTQKYSTAFHLACAIRHLFDDKRAMFRRRWGVPCEHGTRDSAPSSAGQVDAPSAAFSSFITCLGLRTRLSRTFS